MFKQNSLNLNVFKCFNNFKSIHLESINYHYYQILLLFLYRHQEIKHRCNFYYKCETLYVVVTFLKNTGQLEKNKATKLMSTSRRGYRKLTFICKFSISSKINVTWIYEGLDVKENESFFKVTKSYKMKKKLLISKLKAVSYLMKFNFYK